MEFIVLVLKQLLKYSAHLSSNENGTRTSTVKTVLKHLVSANLNSYKSNCEEDPELKSFDTSLRQRTSKLMSSLAAPGKTEYLSLDSLTEVFGFLLKATQDVAKVIIKSKDVLSKNEELRSLVDFYFEYTTQTLNLFNTVENCLKKAETSQLIIRFAVQQFETESMDTDLGGSKKKKYAKTLEELNKFKAMGDPFGEEFVTQYNSVYEQHVLFVEELCKQRVKLEQKHKDIKELRMLSNVVFATVVVSLLVISICSTGAAPVVAAGLSLLSVGAAGIWVDEMLKEAVKKEEDLLLLTEKSSKVNIETMKTINILVNGLITKISSIVETVDFAMERENNELATKLAMQEIMKKVEGFTKKIEDVSEKVAECSKLVVSGRLLVLESINNSKGSG